MTNPKNSIKSEDEMLSDAVVELNLILPRSIGSNIVLDSAAISDLSLHYYYSYEALPDQESLTESYLDSLLTDAQNRISCSLWRPDYMRHVDISFTYHSNQADKLFTIKGTAESCS